jgi:hypothetical protein
LILVLDGLDMSSQDQEDPRVSHGRRELVAVASRYLQGQVNLAETAQAVARWAHRLSIEFDEPFLTFLGIDSELDAFPIGEARRNWRPEALAREDAAREAAEAFYREAAQQAAAQIVAMYGGQAAV